MYAYARVSECLSRRVLERKQRNLEWYSIIDSSSFSPLDIRINMTGASGMPDSKDTIPVKKWSHSKKDTLHFSRAPQSNYGQFSPLLSDVWVTNSTQTRAKILRTRMIGRESLRNLFYLLRRTNVLDSSRIKKTEKRMRLVSSLLAHSLAVSVWRLQH